MEQDKTNVEAMLRSISDEILESKLTAILSSILDEIEGLWGIDDLQHTFWINESEDG